MSVTSQQQMEFTFVGGEGVITYQLEGAKGNDMPTAECPQEWISDLTVAETITFNVSRNEAQEARVATITITYGEQSVAVFVKQTEAYQPAMIEFEAKVLNGEIQGVTESGVYNYFIVLSENGATGWFDMSVDTFYRLDLYSDVAPAEGGATLLPVGVYHFDYLSSKVNGTFSYSRSWRLECMEGGGYTESQFSDGVIVVTETGVEAFLTLTNGEVHYVTYEGGLELGWKETPAPDYYTSLTEDYSFEHKGFVSQIYYYGDADNVGLGNWVITAANSYDSGMNGDYLKVDVYLDSLEYNPELIFGEYTAVATIDELEAGNYLGGVFGSWLYGIEDGYLIQGTKAPLATGKVKIEKSGTGALITVDCVDDLGYKVQGTFECPTVEFYDLSEQM